MSRFERKTKTAHVKNGLMSGALLLTGVVEFFDRLEDGESAGEAALGAFDQTREHAATLREAGKKRTRKPTRRRP
jgi:hypothetical protein